MMIVVNMIIMTIISGLCGPTVFGSRLLHLGLLCLHQGLDGRGLWRGELNIIILILSFIIIIIMIVVIIIVKIMTIILTMTRWTRQPVSAFRAARLTAQSSLGAMSALVIRDGQVKIMMTFMLMRMTVMIIMTMATAMMTMISIDSMTTPGKDCSVRLCNLNCGPHGSCQNGGCVCDEGWTGQLCQSKECDPRSASTASSPSSV